MYAATKPAESSTVCEGDIIFEKLPRMPTPL